MPTKKQQLWLFVLILIILTTACSRSDQATIVPGKINITTTMFPLYDFTSKIGGEHVNVINLVPTGVEAHEWSPKSRDIKNINDSDLFVYLGAGFEGWADEVLKSMNGEGQAKAVETSRGIALISGTHDSDHGDEVHADEAHVHEDDDAHAHEEEAGHHNDGHDHGNYDPHVWLSPQNAIVMARNIKDALVQLDPAHQESYEANFAQLETSLLELHDKYKSELGSTSKKEIVVSHQSFGYLAKEYGLVQVPIMGLTPDAEPTAQTMKDIIHFIEEHQVKTIFFEELVSDRLAKTLARDAGIETSVLHPLEGLTQEQQERGEDYVSIMENNLNNLLKALQ